MAESLLVGRNLVSGICKLKAKKSLKLFFGKKKLSFYGTSHGFMPPSIMHMDSHFTVSYLHTHDFKRWVEFNF